MQSCRIVRWGEARAMPWKNGGGVTHEIAVSPPDASLEDFVWRLSMAEVAADGPFSSFAGIDRTLALMSGAGIELEFADGHTARVDPLQAPCSFDGGAGCFGRLIDGPILDLNIMTRRDRMTHRLTVLELAPGQETLLSAPAAIIGHTGHVHVTAAAGSFVLGARDVLLDDTSASGPSAPVTCRASGTGTSLALVLHLQPVK